MIAKKKSKLQKQGILYLAFQHIGCAADTPSRCINLLHACELLVFEEDHSARQTLKLAKVHRNYLKYNEHSQTDTLVQVEDHLNNGKSVLYMSDQGSPTLADPGKALLKIAYAIKAKVIIIPGPSAISAAIAACPFKMEPHLYLGFLPRKKEELIKILKKYLSTRIPLVILDTPYRCKQLLTSCQIVFPKKQLAFMAQDISGDNEDYITGTFDKIIKLYKPKTNFVLIIK
jgi:16S rRNA (cytidine1402-2'-O)-methyltransferase